VENAALDSIDREILGLLHRDARLTHSQLGRLVGLSPNAAGARVRRMVEERVILGFRAELNHEVLGRPMEASIDVWQNEHRDRAAFARLVADDDRIVECFHLTGPLDYRVRVRVASPQDLNDLLSRMAEEGGVRQTDSRLVLEHLPT